MVTEPDKAFEASANYEPPRLEAVLRRLLNPLNHQNSVACPRVAFEFKAKHVRRLTEVTSNGLCFDDGGTRAFVFANHHEVFACGAFNKKVVQVGMLLYSYGFSLDDSLYRCDLILWDIPWVMCFICEGFTGFCVY